MPTENPFLGHRVPMPAPVRAAGAAYGRADLSEVLAVAGAFAAFTYVSPFLAEITGLGGTALSPILLTRGIAGVVGVALLGLVVDRHPWAAMIVVLVLQGVALILQYILGSVTLVAAATIAVAIAAFSAVLGARTLVVAPGRSDVASAGMSTAFNVGITAGALVGSLLLGTAGIRSTALVGAILTLAAIAVVLAEPLVASAAQRRPLRAVPCPDAAPAVRRPKAITARRADAA